MKKTMMTALIALALTTTAFAQEVPPDMQQQLQGLLAKNKGKDAMDQAIATGVMLGCINKKAGKQATQAFYQEMQSMGQTVKEYCQQGKAAEAQALILSTLDAKQHDPVMQSALACYDSQGAGLESMAGARVSADAAKYARWARDPQLAHKELKPTDVCRSR